MCAYTKYKSRAHEIIKKKKTIYKIKKSCARDNRKEKTMYETKKKCRAHEINNKTIYVLNMPP